MPKLSVIIPTLNSGRSLAHAIDSLLQQTFGDWELLIMDGGSSDDTIAIAKRGDDTRIKVHVANDHGIYDAMNHGIQLANGEWLYFLGSDDYLLESDVLEKMLEGTDNLDMIYGDVEASHLPLEHYGEWTPETLSYNRCHQAIFYRRSVFDRLGLYPLKYPICADHYINLRLFLNKNFLLQYRPIIVAHHSTGGASSTTHDIVFYNDLDRLIVHYGLHSLPKQTLIKHCKAALSHHCTKPQRVSLMLLQSWLHIVS